MLMTSDTESYLSLQEVNSAFVFVLLTGEAKINPNEGSV